MTRVVASAGRKPDFAPVAGPGSDAKYAATSAMSAGLNCAAIAFITWLLREPSFSALSCASR